MRKGRLKFTIPVKPVPQARPRFYVKYNRVKQFIGAYDTKRCKSFKEIIAWQAKKKAMEYGLKKPVTGPVSISLAFQMGENGRGYYTKRPDIDNLAKAVKDALRGVIYVDDSQIVESHLYKRYGKYCIKVGIEMLTEG